MTSLGVNVNSKNAKAAEDFIEWASGPDGATVVAKTGTTPAQRTADVINMITATPGFPTDPASAQALITRASYLEMAVVLKVREYELVLNRVHDEIMANNISIDDGIKEMNDGVAVIK